MLSNLSTQTSRRLPLKYIHIYIYIYIRVYIYIHIYIYIKRNRYYVYMYPYLYAYIYIYIYVLLLEPNVACKKPASLQANDQRYSMKFRRDIWPHGHFIRAASPDIVRGRQRLLLQILLQQIEVQASDFKRQL